MRAFVTVLTVYVVSACYVHCSSVPVVRQPHAEDDSGKRKTDAFLGERLKRATKNHLGAHEKSNKEYKIDHKYFLLQLFEEYGSEGVLTFEGFQHLLGSLGLANVGLEAAGSSSLEHETSHSQSNHRDHEQQIRGHPGESSIQEPQGQNLGRKVAKSKRSPAKDGDTSSLHDHQQRDMFIGNLTDLYFQHSPTDGGVTKEALDKGCLPALDIFSLFGLDSYHDVLTPVGFLLLCPTLVYELEQKHCPNPHSSSSTDSEDQNHQLESAQVMNHSDVPGTTVWLYATASVLVISLCGLFGVAVIPIMQKLFYQQLLQFLVALAVGSLAGDALLHLLPHAMCGSHVDSGGDIDEGEQSLHGHSHKEDMTSEQEAVWKGLTALVALVFFFLAEKILSIIGQYRKNREKKVPPKVKVLQEGIAASNRAVGEKLCKHKYSSYGYCYGDITMEMLTSLNEGGDDHHNCYEKNSTKPHMPLEDSKSDQHDVPDEKHSHIRHHHSNDRHYNHGDCGLQDGHIDHSHMHSYDQQNKKSGTVTGSDSGCNSPDKALAKSWKPDTEDKHKIYGSKFGESVQWNVGGGEGDDSYTVIIREHVNSHHGHSHAHGHVHSPPDSISAVAWMVIMGDGLHNFSDGLAIGAAFAAGVSSGLSTSIAVFCHELPHEIGDFALLLKAGMSPRQAAFYNILSSVLCFFGMLLGIFIGNMEHSSTWVFAGAAGMFLYIALVDMIPELNSAHPNENESGLFQLFLQFLGMTIGGTIMLFIALYEHDLKTIFKS